MDIRNLVNNLSQLEGCRVIEGFLHIVLMEQTDLTGVEFNNYTFPKLREITGYLVLYRVFGLRSIGQLFPNLAVVRGQMLFFDFALVVYELTQLQVINSLVHCIFTNIRPARSGHNFIIDCFSSLDTTGDWTQVTDRHPEGFCPHREES